jgi:hypothetical protein
MSASVSLTANGNGDPGTWLRLLGVGWENDVTCSDRSSYGVAFVVFHCVNFCHEGDFAILAISEEIDLELIFTQ